MTQLFQTTYNGYINIVTVDLTHHGDQLYAFVDSSPLTGPTPQTSTVPWNGMTLVPLAFTTSGYQRGGTQLVKPKISLPDYGALMYVTLAKWNFASGAPVIRYQALAKDVLSNNPNAPFMEEHYLLTNVTFDGFNLDLELATHLDYMRGQFPSHVMLREEYPGLGSQLAD